jgi:hypothetical protein
MDSSNSRQFGFQAHAAGKPAAEPGIIPFNAATPQGPDVIRKLVAEQGATGLERRRGPGRRLSDSLKSAEEGELTKEQFLFLMAIESFKKANGKAYPAWSDVLEVIRLLGYRKTAKSEITLANAEDWQEAWDAPSNVRTARWYERHAKSSEGTPHTPRRKAA